MHLQHISSLMKNRAAGNTLDRMFRTADTAAISNRAKCADFGIDNEAGVAYVRVLSQRNMGQLTPGTNTSTSVYMALKNSRISFLVRLFMQRCLDLHTRRPVKELLSWCWSVSFHTAAWDMPKPFIMPLWSISSAACQMPSASTEELPVRPRVTT